MARKAKKKLAAASPTRSRKTTKVIAVKSARPKKPAAGKPPRKAARRSTAEVAKLRRSVIAGLRAGKPAARLAGELGISRPYLYRLRAAG